MVKRKCVASEDAKSSHLSKHKAESDPVVCLSLSVKEWYTRMKVGVTNTLMNDRGLPVQPLIDCIVEYNAVPSNTDGVQLCHVQMGANDHVRGMTKTNDTLVIATERGFRQYNCVTNQLRVTTHESHGYYFEYPGVESMAAHPDPQKLIVADSNAVCVMRLDPWAGNTQNMYEPQGRRPAKESILCSSDGRTVYVTGENRIFTVDVIRGALKSRTVLVDGPVRLKHGLLGRIWVTSHPLDRPDRGTRQGSKLAWFLDTPDTPGQPDLTLGPVCRTPADIHQPIDDVWELANGLVLLDLTDKRGRKGARTALVKYAMPAIQLYILHPKTHNVWQFDRYLPAGDAWWVESSWDNPHVYVVVAGRLWQYWLPEALVVANIIDNECLLSSCAHRLDPSSSPIVVEQQSKVDC